MLDPVELLVGLVEQPSLSGAEATAVAFLVEQLNSMGFEATIDTAGNAVGHIGEGPQQVVLLGHIDTVPGEIPVRRDGDLLYGRGTVDAKGPLAAFVAAAAQGAPAGLQLTVIAAVGEEAASPGATYVRDHYPRPDFLIIGEPSRWDRVTLGYKGSAWYNFEIERPATHTAGAESSACEQAVELWQAVQAWGEETNDGRQGVFNNVTPTLRAMNSNSDGLTESAQLRIGFRLPPSMSPAELDSQVRNVFSEKASIISVRGAVPAYRAGKNNALVRAALAAIRAEGGEPGFVLKSGTSDMNIVAPGWECPVIAYGPGNSHFDHTPDEHIDITEYLKSIRVLRNMLAGLIPHH